MPCYYCMSKTKRDLATVEGHSLARAVLWGSVIYLIVMAIAFAAAILFLDVGHLLIFAFQLVAGLTTLLAAGLKSRKLLAVATCLLINAKVATVLGLIWMVVVMIMLFEEDGDIQWVYVGIMVIVYTCWLAFAASLTDGTASLREVLKVGGTGLEKKNYKEISGVDSSPENEEPNIASDLEPTKPPPASEVAPQVNVNVNAHYNTSYGPNHHQPQYNTYNTAYGPPPAYQHAPAHLYATPPHYGAPPPHYGASPPHYGAPPPHYGAPPPPQEGLPPLGPPGIAMAAPEYGATHFNPLPATTHPQPIYEARGSPVPEGAHQEITDELSPNSPGEAPSRPAGLNS